MKNNKNKAFTLVEVLAALAVSSIIILACASLLSFVNKININEYSEYRMTKATTYIRNYIVANAINGNESSITYDADEHTMNFTFIDTTDNDKEKTVRIAKDLPFESAEITFYEVKTKEPDVITVNYKGVAKTINRYVTNTWCNFKYVYKEKEYNLNFICNTDGMSYLAYDRNVDGTDGALLYGAYRGNITDPSTIEMTPIFYLDGTEVSVSSSNIDIIVDKNKVSYGDSISYIPNTSTYEVTLKNINSSIQIDDISLGNISRIFETNDADGTKNITIIGSLK